MHRSSSRVLLPKTKPLQVVFENKESKEDRKSFMGEVCKAVCNSVKQYAEANDGVFPEKIVIYRDGVNAGQYSIAKKEAVALTEAIDDVYASPAGGAAKPVPRPNVAVVIVQKRIKTRIYLLDAGAVQNPCAGTVLDHDITMRDLYDFYLVSFPSLFYIDLENW